MSNTLSNNPAFKLEGTFGKYRIYIPTDITQYHMSRYVQFQHQLIFAHAGATPEVFARIADEILNRCNLTVKLENRITDIGVLANEIKYRLKYPVDEHCAIRVGAILSFVEYTNEEGVYHSENPDKYDIFYTKIKEDLAKSDPAAYSFFLSWGVSNIPKYREHFATSISLDYFNKRKETLDSLTPQ